jgi:paraquat-inducible protein B
MSETAGEVTARVGRGPKFSTIWLVPAVAIVIGLWMVYAHWSSQGPLIEITFVSGEGIEAGKTKVKRKNVAVGEVLELRLSDDAEHVVLSVRINKEETRLLREDSQFWVVRPRVGKGGVSGLNTLLSGAYIELSPGSDADLAYQFTGLERPPFTPIGTPGLHITLDSDGNRPLGEGDPVLFHGIEVGKIEYVHFNSEERRTYYNAFVAAPYDRLITTNTRFWLSNGLSVDLSADGIRLEMASLTTVISGGVSFDVPVGQPQGEHITERAFFTIYPREGAINETQYEHSLSYMVLFDDSIRGLKPGAPVEYRGVKVGSVIRTDIDYPEVENMLMPRARIPVLVEIIPARFGFPDEESVLAEVDGRIVELVGVGLRAGLATGSLLTGQKYIELQYHRDSGGEAGGDVEVFAGYKVIPAIDGQLGQLLDNASRTLEVINKLPLDEVLDSAQSALDEIAATLAEFRKSATELDEILTDPASHELIGTLNKTLIGFQQLAGDFSEGSATHAELQDSLRSLAKMLQELEPVLKNLRRQPNSLIFGGSDDEDLEPTGAQE